MTQERIQQWIKRIQVYIEEIIKSNRGNEYMEGSGGGTWRRKWMNA